MQMSTQITLDATPSDQTKFYDYLRSVMALSMSPFAKIIDQAGLPEDRLFAQMTNLELLPSGRVKLGFKIGAFVSTKRSKSWLAKTEVDVAAFKSSLPSSEGGFEWPHIIFASSMPLSAIRPPNPNDAESLPELIA